MDPRLRGDDEQGREQSRWIPAFAGMTSKDKSNVTGWLATLVPAGSPFGRRARFALVPLSRE